MALTPDALLKLIDDLRARGVTRFRGLGFSADLAPPAAPAAPATQTPSVPWTSRDPLDDADTHLHGLPTFRRYKADT